MSVYDPLFAEPDARDAEDLERVRQEFARASLPFLGSPLTWLTWSVVLPAAALVTTRLGTADPAPILLLWSGAILIGGLVEGLTIFRRVRSRARTPLAAWALRSQGNLSLVALLVSALLVWQGLEWALPGVWLLLLGHSFYLLGGLAFTPFRICGLIYQLGGALALAPLGQSLEIFAAATAVGNLWMAYAVGRRRGAPNT